MLPCDVLRLTLDTSCIIHAAQGQHYQSQIDELVHLAREGRVGLWLTSAFHADQIRDSGEKLQNNLAWLAARPVVGEFRVHSASTTQRRTRGRRRPGE